MIVAAIVTDEEYPSFFCKRYRVSPDQLIDYWYPDDSVDKDFQDEDGNTQFLIASVPTEGAVDMMTDIVDHHTDMPVLVPLARALAMLSSDRAESGSTPLSTARSQVHRLMGDFATASDNETKVSGSPLLHRFMGSQEGATRRKPEPHISLTHAAVLESILSDDE